MTRYKPPFRRFFVIFIYDINKNNKMVYNSFTSFKQYLAEAETKIEQESDLDKIIRRSPKVRNALTVLLTSYESVSVKADKEVKDIVSDIKCISFKPTTFRVIFKNSNYFDLIYDPTPDEVKQSYKYRPIDFFRINVNGRKYELSSQADFEQALDSIGIALKQNPIDSSNPDEEQAAASDAPPEETPEKGEGEAEIPTEKNKPNK